MPLAAPRVIVSTVLFAALVLTACGSNAAQPQASPSPSLSPSTTQLPLQAPPQSVLSGKIGAKDGKVYVAKIDNTRPGHPQSGVEAADVVYIEEVEAGETRLAAVYSTQLPPVIGPMRSARITDLELFRQYGTFGFLFSGANPKFLPSIKAAPLVNLAQEHIERGYYRDTSRKAPYNLMLNPAKLPKSLTAKVEVAKPVGFVFGDVPAGGVPTSAARLPFPSATVNFRWSPTDRRWLLSMGARPSLNPHGKQLGGTQVVVQYVTVEGSPYKDVVGAPTPFERTVGSGEALYLRDGQSWRGQWSRPKADQPTAFTVDGAPMPFAAGQVWVVLVRKNAKVTVTP